MSVLPAHAKALDLPRYKGTPQIYVLATQPRCGSHYVAHLLRETRAAGVPFEYFHPRHWESWTKRLRSKNPVFAFRMLCQLRTTENGSFGVKAHWSQFASALKMGLESDLKESDFIYLTRDDLLAQAISHRIALQTGVWISGQEATGTPIFSFDMIGASFKIIMAERSRWERFFAYSDISPYRVSYEEILTDTEWHMTELCRRLGIEWTPPDSAPPAIQRSELNAEWKEKFLRLARERYEDGHFWSQEFRTTET